jgi:RNA polymerase sigma-70 factor (ECF subfamily)
VDDQANEQTWIRLAADGDAEAVGCLYERYADRIYRFIFLRLGNVADAEDVSEQVFVKVIERISSFSWQGSGSFMAWLYRIAYNEVVDFARLRVRKPQVTLEPLHNYLAEEGSDPHGFVEQQDFLLHVKNCMEELTDLQAQVILLKYGAGMSTAEVAEVLGRTPGTIAAVQHQALTRLRGLMGVKGYKSYKK